MGKMSIESRWYTNLSTEEQIMIIYSKVRTLNPDSKPISSGCKLNFNKLDFFVCKSTMNWKWCFCNQITGDRLPERGLKNKCGGAGRESHGVSVSTSQAHSVASDSSWIIAGSLRQNQGLAGMWPLSIWMPLSSHLGLGTITSVEVEELLPLASVKSIEWGNQTESCLY